MCMTCSLAYMCMRVHVHERTCARTCERKRGDMCMYVGMSAHVYDGCLKVQSNHEQVLY